jgi:hypothetical protein
MQTEIFFILDKMASDSELPTLKLNIEGSGSYDGGNNSYHNADTHIYPLLRKYFGLEAAPYDTDQRSKIAAMAFVGSWGMDGSARADGASPMDGNEVNDDYPAKEDVNIMSWLISKGISKHENYLVDGTAIGSLEVWDNDNFRLFQGKNLVFDVDMGNVQITEYPFLSGFIAFAQEPMAQIGGPSSTNTNLTLIFFQNITTSHLIVNSHLILMNGGLKFVSPHSTAYIPQLCAIRFEYFGKNIY